MKNGYGQLFLLILAIGLIFLASTGKGRELWGVITGSVTTAVKKANPTIKDYDKAGSGSGGTMA